MSNFFTRTANHRSVFASSISLLGVALILLAFGLAGCGGSDKTSAGASSSNSEKFTVVAAENFWGSLASQLAGDKATVKSLITSPDTDPHDYSPTPQDARTIASAKMTIVNGLGYDNWASKLIAANPVDGREELNVGDNLGLKIGDNPHQWYSPSSVTKTIDAITESYKKLDPNNAAYFYAQKKKVLTKNLAEYNKTIESIRSKYSGTPVGYSESIFEPLGADLDLKLMTPPGFPEAVSEGTDMSAGDKKTSDQQAEDGEIKVWVFNSQNLSPDVERINQIAKQQDIPIVTVTETLTPAGASFQQWQVAQLKALEAALAKSVGR
jgi:zinc/manganese transport system substrate-binding protein